MLIRNLLHMNHFSCRSSPPDHVFSSVNPVYCQEPMFLFKMCLCFYNSINKHININMWGKTLLNKTSVYIICLLLYAYVVAGAATHATVTWYTLYLLYEHDTRIAADMVWEYKYNKLNPHNRWKPNKHNKNLSHILIIISRFCLKRETRDAADTHPPGHHTSLRRGSAVKQLLDGRGEEGRVSRMGGDAGLVHIIAGGWRRGECGSVRGYGGTGGWTRPPAAQRLYETRDEHAGEALPTDSHLKSIGAAAKVRGCAAWWSRRNPPHGAAGRTKSTESCGAASRKTTPASAEPDSFVLWLGRVGLVWVVGLRWNPPMHGTVLYSSSFIVLPALWPWGGLLSAETSWSLDTKLVK